MILLYARATVSARNNTVIGTWALYLEKFFFFFPRHCHVRGVERLKERWSIIIIFFSSYVVIFFFNCCYTY